VAPDFTLEGAHEGEITSFPLSDNVETGPAVLAFYVNDFSPLCTDQLCDLADVIKVGFEWTLG